MVRRRIDPTMNIVSINNDNNNDNNIFNNSNNHDNNNLVQICDPKHVTYSFM